MFVVLPAHFHYYFVVCHNVCSVYYHNAGFRIRVSMFYKDTLSDLKTFVIYKKGFGTWGNTDKMCFRFVSKSHFYFNIFTRVYGFLQWNLKDTKCGA